MPSLVDWWFGHIASYGQELDDWAEMVFLLWGQHELPSIAEEQLDGEVEYLLEDAFAEITALLQRSSAESQLSFLQAKLRRLQREHREPRVPHRPTKSGAASECCRETTNRTGQHVPHAYEEQTLWLGSLQDARWLQFQAEARVPVFVERRAANRFWLHIFFWPSTTWKSSFSST